MHQLLGPVLCAEIWLQSILDDTNSCLVFSGILKYSVECDELGPLGTLYLDLFPRPGKVPSSGILYPVRCGRELTGAR